MTLRIAVLGSTGSIGCSTLDVVAAHPDELAVVALVAGRNTALLAEQAARYQPALVSADLSLEREAFPPHTSILRGAEGLLAAATHPDGDLVVVATTGHVSIEPTIAALRAGKRIALANKETIVCAGE